MSFDFAAPISVRFFSPQFSFKKRACLHCKVATHHLRQRFILHALFRGAHMVPFFCPHYNESGEIHLLEIWHVECVEDQ
jgi:hypothetical protein